MQYQNAARVAYYCMEFGLSAELTTYSGGLGVLAGDMMKSAGDLHVPIVGVGILWDRGYTRQVLGADGQLVDEYPATDRTLLEATDARCTVTVEGKEIPLTAWRVRFLTHATLLLIEPTEEADRWLTKSLYGGGVKQRIAQEIILGVGGVRILDALGIDVDVHHFNEGHAVFAGHELISRARKSGLSFDDALAAVKSKVVFTTHTPVPAGNEEHDLSLVQQMGAALDLSEEDLVRLGGSPYSMTLSGLRLSRQANAVAQLHGETAREMWKNADVERPIIAITNGVHVPSWQDARIRAALVAEKDEAHQRSELLSAKQAMRDELIATLAERCGQAVSGKGPIVGFARRAATYKRATLVLDDIPALERLLEGGVTLVFSGKAHPADENGKAVVSKIISASRDYPGKIFFLENYDMILGARLTRGCDVWLNNPLRPKEACGTSGMKAAMNGTLNCSILDGWWPEGCEHGVNGWQIAASHDGNVSADDADRTELHRVFHEELLPAFTDRERWLDMMLSSIRMSQWQFSSDRMVHEYYDRLYQR